MATLFCSDFVPPAPPAAYVRIMRLLDDPDVSASQIGKYIGQDPGLTAHVLRLVNSSFMGVRERVGSPQQAVTMLGQRLLKLSVLAYCVKRYVQRMVRDGFDAGQYWLLSLSAATAANQLAVETQWPLPETAFVCGLVSRVGCPALFQKSPAGYGRVLDRLAASGRPLWQLERDVFGVDHAEIGGIVLAEWRMPQKICDAVAHQYRPADVRDEETRRLAEILQAAGGMAGCLETGEAGDGCRRMLVACSEQLDIDFDRVAEILVAAGRSVREVADVLAVEARHLDRAGQIVAKARENIHRLQNEIDQTVEHLRTA